MGKPSFFFFLGLMSAIGRADVSSECRLRAGRSAARVTHGSGRVDQSTKTRRKLHRRMAARESFSGGEISGVDSS
jgi:hypothetical protein